MHKTVLGLLVALCGFGSVRADQSIVRPDYALINKLTHDSSSGYYYPNLFRRYLDNDSTLNADDFKMLYYGYYFQLGYLPTGSSSVYNDSISALMNADKLSRSEWLRVIGYVYKYMESFPFDLEKLNLLFVAYHNVNDEYYSMKYRKKLEMLIKTVLATGDGKTPETGFHVLEREDEFSLLSVLGYDFNGQQSQIPPKCDYLAVSRNADGIAGMYFDISQIFVILNHRD